MPKFDDYTQKTTPEDTDIALILDKTANVNKKTPFSGVWNWIVSKLTSAVISQLETTNKSIVPAINELNSKLAYSYHTIPQPEGIDGITFSNWYVWAYKVGRVINLKLNVRAALTSTGNFIQLFQLPDGFWPVGSSIIQNYITQNGDPMIIQIDTSGNVQIYKVNSGSITDGWVIRQCITYIAGS